MLFHKTLLRIVVDVLRIVCVIFLEYLLYLQIVFAMEPEVLVIDEPISGLDEDAQEWVTDFLKEIRKENRTIIIGTHDKRLLAGLADAELHMNKYHRVEFTSVY